MLRHTVVQQNDLKQSSATDKEAASIETQLLLAEKLLLLPHARCKMQLADQLHHDVYSLPPREIGGVLRSPTRLRPQAGLRHYPR